MRCIVARTAARNLIRLAFLAAIAGGLTFTAANVLLVGVDYDELSATVPAARFTAHTILFWSAAALLLFGLVGLYLVQAERARLLGLIGFAVAFVGTAFALATAWSETFTLAVLAERAPAAVDDPAPRVAAGLAISFLVFVVGWLLFAVATVRARVLPRRPAVALIVGTVGAAVGFAIPGAAALLGVAVAWLGYSAYTSRAGSPA